MILDNVKLRLFIVFGLLMLTPVFAKDATPEHIQCAYEIIQSVKPEIEQEFQLHCNGSGGSFPLQVFYINLSFVAERRATVDEARELVVRCTQKVIHAINAHERIRPHLVHDPLSPQGVEVSISFHGINGCYADGTVSHVFHSGTHVCFSNEDPLHPVRGSFLR